jgi:hypothetical protein
MTALTDEKPAQPEVTVISLLTWPNAADKKKYYVVVLILDMVAVLMVVRQHRLPTTQDVLVSASVTPSVPIPRPVILNLYSVRVSQVSEDDDVTDVNQDSGAFPG